MDRRCAKRRCENRRCETRSKTRYPKRFEACTEPSGWEDWLQELGHDCSNRGWEVFVRRYGSWLRRRCWYALTRWEAEPQWDDVEELVQEVFCRLLEKRGERLMSFRGDSEKALRTFLSKVLRTVVVNHMRYRRAARRNGCFEGDLWISYAERRRLWEPPLDQVPCLSLSPEHRAQVTQQRDQLRDRCRSNLARRSWRRDADILCRALIDGWSSREIALEVCLSPSAVDSVVARARSRLTAAGVDLPERRCSGR